MILTPIAADDLPAQLEIFARSIPNPEVRHVFRRISVSAAAARAAVPLAAVHHRDALRLASQFGLGIRPGSPRVDYAWNGHALRIETEAYVLLHEIAHFQLAAPRRRRVVDFGLGAGPETGDRAGADAAATLDPVARDREEARASLLGILWEADLGHPALASFLDQNWLEGVGRPAAGIHFAEVLAGLRAGGFVDDRGCPTRSLRRVPD